MWYESNLRYEWYERNLIIEIWVESEMKCVIWVKSDHWERYEWHLRWNMWYEWNLRYECNLIKCVLVFKCGCEIWDFSESWGKGMDLKKIGEHIDVHCASCFRSFIWMSHATHTNESRHTYECVMSHVRLSHATPKWDNEWVMSHTWVMHAWGTYELHTYECVTHMCSIVWQMNASRDTYTHMNTYELHTFICVVWLIFSSVTWRIHLSHIWTPMSYTHMSDKWMRHVTLGNESYHTYEWVASHIWMGQTTHLNESCHTYEWVMPLIRICHVAHMYESCPTY